MKEKGLLLLKVGITLCLLFSLARVGKFALSRIPPYSVGTCLADLAIESTGIQLRIESNHILLGYSDLAIESFLERETIKASFDALRDDTTLIKVECIR